MKIHFEHKSTVFEVEAHFQALCRLAEAVVDGVVLLGLVRVLDVWGIIWALVGLILVGLYKLAVKGIIG